eukprot:gb/GECG01008636.1/.p1 GENE.gb/GECG01008636.1/~~gb/GECG01008636.1/.p1  ORF type:complete len:920 (+),score=154.41 gb/GECG01008636.1/:1-2760(+)
MSYTNQPQSRRGVSHTSSRKSKDVVNTLADIFSNYSTLFEPDSDGKSPMEEFPENEGQEEWPSHKQGLRRELGRRRSQPYGNTGHQDDEGHESPSSRSRHRDGAREAGSKAQTVQHYSQSEDASRLGTLWRRAKSENREKDRTIASIKSRLKQGEDEQEKHDREALELRDMTQSNAELKDKIRFLEIQLDEYKTDNTRLRDNYQESLTKLSESLRVLEEKASHNEQLSEENEDLKQRVQQLEEEKESLLNRSLENLRAYEEDSLEKQRQLNLHKDAVTAAEEQSKMLRAQMDQANERIAALESSNLRCQEDVEAARKDKERAREEAERASQAAQMADSLRTQVKHTKLDNARLVRLLATTKEYKEFANYTFTPDSAAATGRLRGSYLSSVPSPEDDSYEEYLGGPAKSTGEHNNSGNYGQTNMASWREIEAYEQHYGVDDSQQIDAEREHDLWVPSEALRLTIRFRRQYLPHVPTQIIRNFLKNLNSIWRRRYTRQLAKVKEEYDREISALKRKNQQKAPYREVLQASTISRMHQQMEALRKACGGQIGFPLQDSASGKTLAKTRKRSNKKKTGPSSEAKGATSNSKKNNTSLWGAAVSFGAPLSTTGAGNNRSEESSRIMEHALGAVENLSRQVSELKEENQRLSRSLDDQGEKMIPKDDLTDECKQAYLAAVLWLGGQWMKHTNVLVEHSSAICAAMRSHLLDHKTKNAGGSAYSDPRLSSHATTPEERQVESKTRSTDYANLIERQIEHICAIEREVYLFRDRSKKLYSQGIECGLQTDLYTQSRNEVRDVAPLAQLEELGLPNRISGYPTFSQQQNIPAKEQTQSNEQLASRDNGSIHCTPAELPHYSSRPSSRPWSNTEGPSNHGYGTSRVTEASYGSSSTGYNPETSLTETRVDSKASSGLGRVDMDDDMGVW